MYKSLLILPLAIFPLGIIPNISIDNFNYSLMPISSSSQYSAYKYKTSFIDSEDIWKVYGPLRINLSKLRAKGFSYLVPALNKDNKPLYIAVNCLKNKINVTGKDVKWTGWFNPKIKFEFQLLNDLCATNIQ